MQSIKHRFAVMVASALLAFGSMGAAAQAPSVAPLPGGEAGQKLFGVGDTVLCLNCAQETTQWGSWAQQWLKWADQLRAMADQLRQLERTYDTLKNPRAYIRSLANSVLEQQVRRYMPADFEEAMSRRYLVGPYSTNPFERELGTVMSQYPIGEWWNAFNGLTSYREWDTRGYSNRLRSAQAMMAGSLVAQRNLTSRLDSVERLIDAASNADDLKASVDTGSRISAEVAMLMVEGIRLQSQHAYLTSNEAQRRSAAHYRALQMSRWRDRSW